MQLLAIWLLHIFLILEIWTFTEEEYRQAWVVKLY